MLTSTPLTPDSSFRMSKSSFCYFNLFMNFVYDMYYSVHLNNNFKKKKEFLQYCTLYYTVISTCSCMCLDYHGKGGYLSVSDGIVTPLNKNVYARAMEELGFSITDCNGKSQIGTLLQCTRKYTNLTKTVHIMENYIHRNIYKLTKSHQSDQMIRTSSKLWRFKSMHKMNVNTFTSR
jgi:hypothetical protein